MIRFPQMHLADSAVSRILATTKALTPRPGSTAAQGQALEKALAAPPVEAAAPDGTDQAILMRALEL